MMSSQDFNFVDILKRKRIKLTLRTAAYIGTVQRINLNKTIILEDVVDVKNGRKIPGVKMFFGHEVLNVEMPDETQSRKPPDQILEGHLIVDEFQPYRKSVTLDGDEDDEEDYINFVVIDEFHEKFGPAVMQIKKQQVIGVGADGVEAMQRLCWLQIATKNTVYLFDILQLGGRAFKNGLSMILESKRILKVIHDSKGIAACLTTSFGVKLTNVFDTQVADVLWFYKETGGILPDRVSTLEQVVGFHLEVPSSRLSSLLMKSKLTKEDGEIWYKRPCPVALLKVMALSVIHLQPLRLMLLDALMKDYTDLVNAYLTSDPGYLSNELDLPLELRDMERIREERYEMAIQMYPLTDQGLLERYNPRPQPKISPPANDHQNQDTPRPQPKISPPANDHQNQDTPRPQPKISPPANGHQNQDNPRPQPKISPPANGHQNQDNPRPQPKISPPANGHQNQDNPRPQPKISPPANGHQNLDNSRPQSKISPPANAHQNLDNSRPQPEMLPPANGRWNQDQDALPQMELVDSAYPATVEPISPMRVDSPCPQPYAPSPVAQIPATAPASDLKKTPSSSVPPPDEAPGLMEMMMDTIGRGWPLKKDPQSSVPVFPVFPSFGRGFPVHMPQPQKTPGAMVPPTLKSTPANGAIPKTVLPGSDVGLEVGYSNPTPQHLVSQLSPLSRSFNSFRST